MKENLIFGADITSFGAVGDGKTDCTQSFNDALCSGHNLITVPYGEYLIKSTLTISSNTKLHIHPAAKIIFEAQDQNSLITATDDASSIIICGGNWYVKCEKEQKDAYVFDFCGVENLKMQNMTVNAESYCTIKAQELCDFRFESIICNTRDAVCFINCSDGVVRNLTHTKGGFTLSFDGENNNIYVTHTTSKDVGSVIVADGVLNGIRIFDVFASFENHVLCTKKTCVVSDMLISGICAYNHTSTSACAYFELYGKHESLEIESFKRDTDSEALPKIPTLKAKNTRASVIIDGIALDEIISAKALSKITSMVPARLCDPHGKFVYTLETTLENADSFIIPSGKFDTLQVYGH